MNSLETIEDDEAVLARLLGNETVATPATLNAAVRWLKGTIGKMISERPLAGEQQWGTAGDVAKRYGITQSQAHVWLKELRRRGKVRFGNPPTGKSGKGDTYYYLPSIDAAIEDNARILEERRCHA